jgi:PAS domain S-box-containing protein
LVKEGVVSALACPLVHPRGPLGALCICSTNRCEFSSADTHFVESVAHLLAISFARQSAEQLVLQQSRRLDALVKSSETPMVEMTAQARITHCNPALEQLTQFHRSQLEGRSFFSAFVLPEELREVQRVLNGVRDGQDGGRVEFFLLTKTGFRRRMAWSFRRVAGEDGTASAIVGTGVDITDQYEMVHRLQRAEAMTEHAVQSLRVLTSKASRGELGATASAPRTDRRSKKRRSFPIKQCIAPIVGGSMPAPDLYREVDCHDLSCSGFSYRSNGIPDYQKIVVALGKQGGIIHVIAEVVHVTPLLNPGEELYLVGCRYIGRAGADQIENDTPRS